MSDIQKKMDDLSKNLPPDHRRRAAGAATGATAGAIVGSLLGGPIGAAAGAAIGGALGVGVAEKLAPDDD